MGNLFSTKGKDTTERSGVSQFLTYGLQMATITGFTSRVAQSGKKTYSLNLEGPKVTEAGFEAHQDAKLGGKIGRAQFTIYIDPTNEKSVNEVMTNIGIIADKLGVRDQVDAVVAEDLDSYLNKAIVIFRGKYAHWGITAEEYEKPDGKVGIVNKLRRYGFIASMEEGEAHLRPFDKTNIYDYKPLAAPSKDPDVDAVTEAFGPETTELPWD